jgi:outer membrane protein X
MKKLNFIIAAAALGCASTLSATNLLGEKTLGVQTGYTSSNRSALAGIELTYRLKHHVRLAPSLNYVFQRHNSDALSFNFNVQFPFTFAPKFEFFPIAGVSFASWNFHNIEEVASVDVSSRLTRFGLNAGAGVGFHINATTTVSLKAEYKFIEDCHGTNIFATLAYRF